MILRDISKKIIDELIYLISLFISPKKSDVKKLVIIRKDVVGDFIIFYPTLSHYRSFYSDYKITLICSVVLKDLTNLIKEQVDEIIWYDENKFRNSLSYRINFMLRLKKEGYEIAIYPVYTRELAGDHMVRITQAKERIGFSSQEIYSDTCNSFYTKLIKTYPDENEFDRNFSFVSLLQNKTIKPLFPTINTSEFDTKSFENLSEKFSLDTRNYVVITPGSNLAFKMWPIERFAEVITFLHEQGLATIILGTKKEKDLAETLLKKIKHKEKCIDLVGETDLQTVFLIVKNAKFYFGNDTGTLHMTAAVKTKAIAVMGGGHLGRFFPYADLNNNRIIFDKGAPCKNDNWKCLETVKKGAVAPCIMTITTEQVIEELKIFV